MLPYISPNTVSVTVPDFTGRTQADIIAAGYLKKLDIKFEIVDDVADGYAGKVYQQSLNAGFLVTSGTEISIVHEDDFDDKLLPKIFSDHIRVNRHDKVFIRFRTKQKVKSSG